MWKSSRASILYLLLLVLAVAVVSWVVFLRNDSGRDQEIPENTDQEFISYVNEEFGFSILRPENSTVSLESNSNIKIMFSGPDAIANSELTDGFMVLVSKEESVGDLKSLAEEKFKLTQESGGLILKNLESTQLNQIPAYKYSYKTLLENIVDAYVLKSDKGYIYQISYTIIDPQNRNYNSMVEKMLESLKFI